MIKILSLMLLLLVTNQSVFAQNKYEIGIEGGVTFDKYKIEDVGNNLRTVPCVSGMGGVNFRINTKTNFFYEVALIAKGYTEGIKMKQQEGYGVSNGDQAILLPVRIGYIARISKEFSLIPVIGLAAGLKNITSFGTSEDSRDPTPTGLVEYGYAVREPNKKVFALAQIGFALKYIAYKRIGFSLGYNSYIGLSKIKIYDVRYRINSGPQQNGIMYTKGSFGNLNAGISYLLKTKDKGARKLKTNQL